MYLQLIKSELKLHSQSKHIGHAPEVKAEQRKGGGWLGLDLGFFLFLNMTWLCMGATFETGDEREKRMDETPAWRSYRMQEKTAAEAEFEDWIILAVI